MKIAAVACRSCHFVVCPATIGHRRRCLQGGADAASAAATSKARQVRLNITPFCSSLLFRSAVSVVSFGRFRRLRRRSCLVGVAVVVLCVFLAVVIVDDGTKFVRVGAAWAFVVGSVIVSLAVSV